MAVRLFVISDLHLGGEEAPMMSKPDSLARFIDGLPATLAQDERLELVINGDAVDFLATTNADGAASAWTPDPTDAVARLHSITRGVASPVFEALGRHLARGHRLVMAVGNHDVELGLPAVQDAFAAELGAAPLWVDDGRAWRVGGALIEHGNRYDDANLNDWDGLRRIRSHQSRGEAPPIPLTVSAGSTIVERIVTPLKRRYPFLDLLQPQGPVVAFLLLCFEPSLRWDIGSMLRMLRGAQLSERNAAGGAPREGHAVAALGQAPTAVDRLAATFGVELPEDGTAVGAGDWARELLRSDADSLATLIRQGAPVDPARLDRLRDVLIELTAGDQSLDLNGDPGLYGRAARRMVESGAAQVVIMGHTHHARSITAPGEERPYYLNTGTWADLVHVPPAALAAGATGRLVLTGWLTNLLADRGVRRHYPCWADLRVERDGAVSRAELVLDTGRRWSWLGRLFQRRTSPGEGVWRVAVERDGDALERGTAWLIATDPVADGAPEVGAWAVTAWHVVERAHLPGASVSLWDAGKRWPAEVVGVDREADIALLRVQIPAAWTPRPVGPPPEPHSSWRAPGFPAVARDELRTASGRLRSQEGPSPKKQLELADDRVEMDWRGLSGAPVLATDGQIEWVAGVVTWAAGSGESTLWAAAVGRAVALVAAAGGVPEAAVLSQHARTRAPRGILGATLGHRWFPAVAGAWIVAGVLWLARAGPPPPAAAAVVVSYEEGVDAEDRQLLSLHALGEDGRSFVVIPDVALDLPPGNWRFEARIGDEVVWQRAIAVAAGTTTPLLAAPRVTLDIQVARADAALNPIPVRDASVVVGAVRQVTNAAGRAVLDVPFRRAYPVVMHDGDLNPPHAVDNPFRDICVPPQLARTILCRFNRLPP